MICFNGEFHKVIPKTVSPFSESLEFGLSVFETLRTYNETTIFRLEDHLNRLWHSAEIIGVTFSFTKDSIKANLIEIARRNRIAKKNLRLKIFLTADFYWIRTNKLIPLPESVYQKGVSIVDTTFQRNFAEAKYPGFAYSFYEKKKTKLAYEIIFFNEQGFLREGNISNIFMVKNGQLLTPKNKILKGVTRSVVLETAKSLNITTYEKEITRQDLLTANEIFLTNTTKEIVPVREWTIWKNNNFMITQKLHSEFKKSLIN